MKNNETKYFITDSGKGKIAKILTFIGNKTEITYNPEDTLSIIKKAGESGISDDEARKQAKKEFPHGELDTNGSRNQYFNENIEMLLKLGYISKLNPKLRSHIKLPSDSNTKYYPTEKGKKRFASWKVVLTDRTSNERPHADDITMDRIKKAGAIGLTLEQAKQETFSHSPYKDVPEKEKDDTIKENLNFLIKHGFITTVKPNSAVVTTKNQELLNLNEPKFKGPSTNLKLPEDNIKNEIVQTKKRRHLRLW
jgi:hypothetical protein